jgi:transposase
MPKQPKQIQGRVDAGGDVSSTEIVVALQRSDGRRERSTFANDPTGHKSMIVWLTKRGSEVRIVIEATGIYSLDVAFALERATGVEVMVANPRAIADFARALMHRSKTDKLDAEAILEFCCRMPFVPWVPPSQMQLNLRSIMRRIASLKLQKEQENNRLHAAEHAREITPLIRRDIEMHLKQLERHIKKLDDQAFALVCGDEALRRAYDHLISTCGIARTSGLQLLGELAVLPQDMSNRQWVAHAGLDPRAFDSGTSIHKPARISRHGNQYLRAALYMPALVAAHHHPNVRAFYEKLLGKGKLKMQAIVAVMRKLLHAIHGMLRTDSDFDGEKFYAMKA